MSKDAQVEAHVRFSG